MAANSFSITRSNVNSVINQLETTITQMETYKKNICDLEKKMISNWEGEASKKFDQTFNNVDVKKMLKAIRFFIAFVKLLKDILEAYEKVDGVVAAIFA